MFFNKKSWYNYFSDRFYVIKYQILRDENFRTVTDASTVDRKKHLNTVQGKINENNTKGKIEASYHLHFNIKYSSTCIGNKI